MSAIRFASITLVVAFAFAACGDVPTEPDATTDASLAAKGGEPGPPGGGDGGDGGGDDGPTDPIIAYTSHGSGSMLGTLYVTDAAGATAQVLSSKLERDFNTRWPNWSPDGSTIAIAQYATGPKSSVDRLARVSPDGSGYTVLQEGNDIKSPRWSPIALGGSERIAFVMDDLDGSGNDQLYIIDPDGSNLTQLTQLPATDCGVEAEWSPDGAQLFAVFEPCQGGFPEVTFRHVLYDVSCTAVCSLTDSVDVPIAGFNWVSHADWGRTAANTSTLVAHMRTSVNEEPDLYTIDLSNPAGPIITNLTNTPAVREFNPSWSPDDQQIAYVRYAVGTSADFELVTQDLVSGTVTVLTNVEFNFGVDWSM